MRIYIFTLLMNLKEVTMNIKTVSNAKILIGLLIAILVFTSCSKKESDIDKSFLNNREKKESYVVGTDLAMMIKAAGNYQEQFSKDVFFKGFTDRFGDQELQIGIEEIRKIMNSATDSVIVNMDTVKVGIYNTIKDKQSYIFGAFHADMIAHSIETFNFKAFQKGFNDEFDNIPRLLSDEEIRAVKEYSRKWVEKIMSSGDPALSAEEKEKIYKEYLVENSKREIVKTLPSGLQYAVIKEGSGANVPDDSTMVKVNYRALFIDGREFDSSYKKGQPAEFMLKYVIAGWREGIKLMPVGSKYKFFVPAELAYGKEGLQDVPPNATLIFEVELLDIAKNQ